MCFIVSIKIEYTADKDIVCYKIVRLEGKKIFSAYRGSLYYLNKKRRTIKLSNDFYVIHKGYHSYINLHHLNLHHRVNDPYTMVECIIPKGSKYYINESEGEYVSSSIIITEIL